MILDPRIGINDNLANGEMPQAYESKSMMVDLQVSIVNGKHIPPPVSYLLTIFDTYATLYDKRIFMAQ